VRDIVLLFDCNCVFMLHCSRVADFSCFICTNAAFPSDGIYRTWHSVVLVKRGQRGIVSR